MGGIGFALSASDLIEVLQRFYPSAVPAIKQLATPSDKPGEIPDAPPAEAVATVKLYGAEGAGIWVDGGYVGNLPATLTLRVGPHNIVVRDGKHADWTKTISIMKDSEVSLQPWMEMK